MSPATVLSLVLIIFYGSVAHMLLGRRIWQWPLFLAAAFVGYVGGFVAGVVWSIDLVRVGDVPLLAATFGAAGCIALAWFFSSPAAGSATPDSNS